jgi:hypothetical protein
MQIKTNSLLTKTQADGAQTVSLNQFDCAKLHQIQVIVSATPAAGTLTVAIKTPGASTYSAIPWTIDLTALSTNSVFQLTGFVESIQFTPSGFDADKTYSVYICTGDKGLY